MTERISEMGEIVSRYIEDIRLEEDTEVDIDKIRRMVLHKINGQSAGVGQGERNARSRKWSTRTAVIVAMLVAIMTSAVAVNAAIDGKLFGTILLTDDNRDRVKRPNYASMTEVAPGGSVQESERPAMINSILSEAQLQSLPGNSVTNIAVKDKMGIYNIPEMLTNNGDIVIITKEGDTGWMLDKGERLTLQYELDLESSPYSDKAGEYMEIGFIRNGELVRGTFDKARSFSYTLNASEAGEYYFYVENYSAGYIIISSGTIESSRE